MSKKEPQLPCTKVKTSPTKSPTLINAQSPLGLDNRNGVVSRMSESLAQRRKNTPIIETKPEVYGEWKDRFISVFVPALSEMIPNLVKLNLCGSHLTKDDLAIVLSGLKKLEWLDISYSTLKSDGLSAVARYCRTNLKYLDMSGIFKFGRNKVSFVVDIVMFCEGLKTMVMLDNPEFYKENLDECYHLSAGRIEFITDMTSSTSAQ